MGIGLCMGACGGGGGSPGPVVDAMPSDAVVDGAVVTLDAAVDAAVDVQDAALPADAALNDALPPDAAPAPDAAPDAAPVPDAAPAPDAVPAPDAAPPPPAGPCADGLDNDGDGLIDFPVDPECGAPDAPDEASLCALNVPYVSLGDAGGQVALTLGGGDGQTSTRSCGEGAGLERIVAVTLTGPATVDARLSAPSGGVQLSLRAACDDVETELDCDAPAFGAAALHLDVPDPRTLFFIAEGTLFEPAAAADLQIDVTETPAAPEPAAPEVCPLADAPLVVPHGGGRVAVRTAEHADVFPRCAPDGLPGAPEQILVVKFGTPSALHVETVNTEQDTILGLWGVCDPAAAPLRCDDDGGAGTRSVLDVARLVPGTYFLSVEAANAPNGLRCDVDVTLTPVAPLACDNGVDDDGDARVDADDPGCATADDPDETDPDVPRDCSDGLDNNGDGTVDYPDDPTCVMAGASTETGLCGPGVEVIALPDDGGEVTVDHPPVSDVFGLPCGTGGPVAEHIFSLTLSGRARVQFSVDDAEGRAPLAIGAYDACDGGTGPLDCVPPLNVFPATVEDHPGGTIYFAVEVPAGVEGAAGPLTARATVESLIRACNDGVDSDGDGLVDAFDPGCINDFDNDETDDFDPADPAARPACSNGLDDDGDGLVDYPTDADCLAAGGRSEQPTCDRDVPITRMSEAGGRLTLTTAGRDQYVASCGNPIGPEQVIALHLDHRADVSAVVENNSYDTVLFMRRACDDGGTEIACNDDTNGVASAISVQGLEPGTYFIFLDGWSGAIGTCDVVVTVTPVGGP